MEENKNKFLPTLVKKIKYTKKVKVADIKSYLVDEFNLAKELTKENKNLKKDLDKAKITEQKYDLALVTLDEYKARLSEKNKEINQLEEKIKKLNENINLLTNERNDLKLKSKNINLEIEKIKKDGYKEYKNELTKAVVELKGHLSKEIILDIISKY